MADTLQGIRQLELDRNRAVDELRRLQRAVARRDDQDSARAVCVLRATGCRRRGRRDRGAA